ncbi:CHASE domain-containing protein [Myxococcus xanthus]|uniref:CHASE domain-containing protein n=6 Tax=Myxococcus TaxID=32 RepID=UPI0008958408|nr:CHASE domain-containing protein [Myxococcus xanthus]QZZ54548.1 Adaptive-response sensory-kinase SasA [Myxococcus xanthus]UYI14182.1 CHASE domain-containing protein [Myxococcus xanthus]UYI21549.1 CHASE domain-containing protein [Myxococcus xanthus]SDW14947.1 Signal transduction histidine kinase [Myxococcus xanthus]
MPPHSSSHLRRNAAAYCVVLVGLLLTAVSATYVQQSIHERRLHRFDGAVHDGVLGLQQRLELNQSLLQGVHGLFTGSRFVSQEEFDAYLESLKLNRSFPELEGIGFARWLRPQDVARYDAKVRGGQEPGHPVWPPGPRAAYTAIIMLNPLNARTQQGLGFDMLTEPNRRAAMLRALGTRRQAATHKVRLIQGWEDAAGRWGIVLFIPVYTRPKDTPPPRPPTENLRGFVYLPLAMEDLMSELRFIGFQETIDLEVYDGTEVRDDALLYASSLPASAGAPVFQQDVKIPVAGQTWTLRFNARQAFIAASTTGQHGTVVGAGLLVTLLLFFITRSQVRARTSAEAANTEQQRLTGEARDAVQVRDDFLSIAAHELRTPLTNLKLQLQLLYRQLRREEALDVEKLAQRVLSCERQTSRLATLVDSLLDVSRLARGRMELNLEPVDLDELVREAVRRFETEARTAGVQVTVDSPAPVTGQWDRMRLEQVLTNLLSNALKYGHGAPVDVRVRSDETQAMVEVEDRGIGLPPEDAQRIFGRFERAVSSRHYGGLGLGLFITRQLVEALGGHISVASTPGQGATFTVALPLSGPRAEA